MRMSCSGILSLLVGILLASIPGEARASLTQASLTPGQSSIAANVDGVVTTVRAFRSYDGATNSGTTGTFAVKTVNGLTGTGVATGTSGAEIDIGQALVVSFASAVTLATLDIGFLFNNPDFNDRGRAPEQARFQFYNGASLVLTTELRVTGDTSALYLNGPSGSSVTNLGSAASGTGQGSWRIGNPAGGLQVTRLVLRAVPNSDPLYSGRNANSDYSFVRLTLIPEPSTLAMAMGAAALGVLGLGVTRLRRGAPTPG